MVSVVACWALLLQVLIPLAHVPPPQSTVDSFPAGALASLCHAGQAQFGKLTDRRQDGQQTPTDNPPICPICLGLHLAGTFTPPTVIALAIPRATGGVEFIDGSHLDPPASFRSPAQARAPPFNA